MEKKVISFSVINWKVLLNRNCLKGLSIIWSPYSVAAVALYTLQTDYFKRSLISCVRYLWNVKAAIIQIHIQHSLCDNPYWASLLRNKTLFNVVDLCVRFWCALSCNALFTLIDVECQCGSDPTNYKFQMRSQPYWHCVITLKNCSHCLIPTAIFYRNKFVAWDSI